MVTFMDPPLCPRCNSLLISKAPAQGGRMAVQCSVCETRYIATTRDMHTIRLREVPT